MSWYYITKICRFNKFKLTVLSLFIFSTVFYSYNFNYSAVNVSWHKVILSVQNNNVDLLSDEENDELMNTEFRWCPNDVQSNPNINCESLFAGDWNATKEAKQWKSPCTYKDSQTAQMTENCTNFKRNFVFWSRLRERMNESDSDSRKNTAEEFPIAYVIIGARNGEQMIRLFQSIYLKKNLYCLTYDNKSSEDFKTTLHNLDKCYDNVFMPDEFVDVYWAGFSILQTAMNCLKVLVNQNKHRWKYVQILSYNDYPLRTNEETVNIMQIFNGSQDSLLSKHSVTRSRKFFEVYKVSTIMNDHLKSGHENRIKPVPPGNLIEYKGSLATTMSREFVGFLFENPISRKFYEWSNTTYMPEEMYFSTVIHNLHIKPPGGFPGACQKYYEEMLDTDKPYISRYQIWNFKNSCKGMTKLFSCVYGVADLVDLIKRPELIAHKVYLEFQPATYYCLAQLHYNRTLYPESYSKLDIKFYNNLPAVRYQRMLDKKNFEC